MYSIQVVLEVMPPLGTVGAFSAMEVLSIGIMFAFNVSSQEIARLSFVRTIRTVECIGQIIYWFLH